MFKTSTAQQALSNLLSMSPKASMQSMQRLYEAGKITYMRTESTTASVEFQKECVAHTNNKYGEEYCNKIKEKRKRKEAHECMSGIFKG